MCSVSSLGKLCSLFAACGEPSLARMSLSNSLLRTETLSAVWTKNSKMLASYFQLLAAKCKKAMQEKPQWEQNRANYDCNITRPDQYTAELQAIVLDFGDEVPDEMFVGVMHVY